MKLGLVGCGKMGEAILGAALKAGVAVPADIVVAEANPERAKQIAARYAVAAGADATLAADGADLLIFAVRPQEFAAAAGQLRGRLRANQTVVSIMAGVRIDAIARTLGHAAVVRVMPNAPAAIGAGMSVWLAVPDVSQQARAQVASLLEALGLQVQVDQEQYLDMATALSGSGPAFVYLLIEAFIDAGVHVGLHREVAETLALQTFIGAAKYAQVTGKHPAQLRNEVTSPAGTTAAGLLALETAGVRGAIIDAVEAAYNRSRELGE